MNDVHAPDAHKATLDPENPWLGLDSYTEATGAYFHGRDEESAELARRVQRKLLTVLFGQSGLGKTSLLRAGLVPRLRKEGYCPVYVRIVYAAGSPAPSDQIKQAIFRATQAAGHWTRPGISVEGEPLWEFLHHRGDLLRDAEGRNLMPLLIFDQFEEIFTLGQADDAGRLRAREFLEDLADLVENRAPAALEARMEQDDTAAEDFDFARADYRVLIALREDYLAHLESLKDRMPSITQNRMRLARMTGAQALSAVVKPGGKLVSQEVAEAIVRFVAGGSELANAEIEPSLLSLVCRELNTARLAQGREEISADLLAGSRDTILSEFYARALADQPEGVRRVVEDELLTESGYRESLAEERVKKALAEAGAAPDALATLVNRRLLRIEERLDMRRVELTHDVLCGVVLASRNQRHAREAREAAERQLAAQREREAAVHRALVRTRMIAIGCAVLLVLAIIAAVFGFVGMHRAHVAETEAQASRTHAEDLVGFMIGDFYNDLAPTGRLGILGKLAQRTVDYYNGLPPALITPQTKINKAMALVRLGEVQERGSQTDAGYKNLKTAEAAFENLRAGGQRGEAVTYGLALAAYSETDGVIQLGAPGSLAGSKRAADLLWPLVHGSHPSRRVRQLYADDLNLLTLAGESPQQAVAGTMEARTLLAGLGALDLSDLTAAAAYADTTDSEARAMTRLGRLTEAQTLEQQVYELAGKILAKSPGNLHALDDRFFAAELLSVLATRRYNYAAAAEYAKRAAQAGEDWVRFDPSDLAAWASWAGGLDRVAAAQRERGDISGAIATLQSMVALERDPRRPSSLGPVVSGSWGNLVELQGQTGQFAAAARSTKSYSRDVGEFLTRFAAGDVWRRLLAQPTERPTAILQLDQGHWKAALAGADAAATRVDAVSVEPGGSNTGGNTKSFILESSLGTATIAAMQLGRYAQAEVLARRLLAVPPPNRTFVVPLQDASEARALLAAALAMQGKRDEARTTLQPALAWYVQQQKAGATGTTFRHDYAYALYVNAIAAPTDGDGPKQRAAALKAAAAEIAGTSEQAQQLVSMRRVSALIAKARHTAPAVAKTRHATHHDP
ncbi:MAG: hypothetical protein ACREP0_07015 [Rhodanobacteraceae bacterium]